MWDVTHIHCGELLVVDAQPTQRPYTAMRIAQ